MKLNISPKGKKTLIIITVATTLVVAIFFVVAKSIFNREPTVEEVRLQHLEYIVKVIEAYGQKNGTFPQPTVRIETSEGIQHVWGYGVDKKSLASCTVKLGEDGNPSADDSRCGGGIFDVNGELIGWKGTFTAESGLNNIEIANRGSGRIDSPVSEITPQVPTDPAYSLGLSGMGFGEYIYAVRIPSDAGENKGGSEYQIAGTVMNSETGEKSTFVRGNYFVRSDEQGILPSSLIGPGLLFDSHGNPSESQDQPIHVLVDAQREGYPNPVLGDGEEILKVLTLKRRANRLNQAAINREEILDLMVSSPAIANFKDAISNVKNGVEDVITGLSSESPDLVLLESDILDSASDLIQAGQDFISSKGEEVSKALQTEVSNRSYAINIINQALIESQKIEDSVLLARDEVIRYLDGEGIEEQIRSRVDRKLDGVLEDIPDIADLFIENELDVPHPFLTKGANEKVEELKEKESIEVLEVLEDNELEEGEPAVMITTVTAELFIHFDELSLLLKNIQEDLRSSAVTLEEIDESLGKLSNALANENERIGELMDSLADHETASALLSNYDVLSKVDIASAIANVARLSKQNGDFAPLVFSEEVLNNVLLEKSPGIPDYDSYENAYEAEYQGIPYPLP